MNNAEYDLTQTELESLTDAIQEKFSQSGVVVAAGWSTKNNMITTGAIVQVILGEFKHTHLWSRTTSPEVAGRWECRPFSVKWLLDHYIL